MKSAFLNFIQLFISDLSNNILTHSYKNKKNKFFLNLDQKYFVGIVNNKNKNYEVFKNTNDFDAVYVSINFHKL